MESSPNISPGTQSDESHTHGEVGQVGQRIEAEETEEPRDNIEEHGHNEEGGRGFESFEDVLALVLHPVVLKLLFDFLHSPK